MWAELKNQVFLGDEVFVEQLKHYLAGDKDLSEVPSSQRRKKPLSLKEYEAKAHTRDTAIVSAYASGGYTQKQIGEYYELHYTWISRIISKAKRKT